MIFNPYVIGATLLILAITHAGAFLKGRSYEGTKQKAEHAKQLEKVIADANANALVDMSAALEVGQSQAKVREVIRTVREQVAVETTKPVYQSCGLEPAGVELWNRAVSAGSQTPAPGKPDPAPARLPRIN